MRYLTGFFILLAIFTGCEDKGYGTQDISNVPSVTSTEKVRLIDSIPSDNAAIATRSYINIAFSSYIDPNSVNTTNISLQDTNGSVVGTRFETVRNYLYIRPNEALTENHTYTLKVASNVEDILGNRLENDYALKFHCKRDFWQSVDAGGTHAMAKSKDGHIYVWGSNELLQLVLAEDIVFNAINIDIPLPLPTNHIITDFSAGSFSSVLITEEGTILSAGINALAEYNEAGYKQVSVGRNHIVTVKKDGRLFSWGNNGSGQLGNLSILNQSEPVQEYSEESNWSSARAGNAFSIALKKDGTLWGWGKNNFGQIGSKRLNERRQPIQEDTNATDWAVISAGSAHSVAIKKSGSLWSWGKNDSGELGIGTTANVGKEGVQEDTNATWNSVSAGFNHTLAIDTNNTLWSWGNNYHGQLGDGSTVSRPSPTKINSDVNWTNVSAGAEFSVGVKADGSLWAWGYNVNGQLGFGVPGNDITKPKEVGHDD